MTTRNFVPRNNNEGQLGTENKKWNKIYTNEIFATNFTGNLTGTADNAIKDNKNQQIDSTYIKDISVNNDTLIITKGNNDSQDITINNISHAISSDNAINASKLQGLTTGNKNGQIPINNGTENTNLNAALLNGKASSYFATSNHTHTTATQSSNGYMSNADKKKLDGIASGAEVNQNTFANVKVGSNTIQADAKQDTLELAAGTNISLVGDANNDKVTIAVTGKVASASQADSATEAGNINKGFQVNEENFHSSDFRQTILGRANSGICARPFCGKLPNNTAVSSPGMAFGGIDTHGFIQLEYGTPSAYVGGGNANKINWYKKLAFTDSNVASATKATQDKNGRDITGYLYKSESIGLDSNASVVTSGTISAILNAFSTKFKQIQGTGTYGESPPTSLKSLNDNKAPKASPAFSGTPTAPTPGTSDNGTRIATTAFVQSLISSVKSLVNTKNDVYIGNGTGSVNNTTFTIPLPSGYSRGQCRYVVVPNNVGYNAGFALNVNQGTGAVSGYSTHVNTSNKYSLSFYYVVIAVK